MSVLWDNLDTIQMGATWFYTDFKDKISDRPVVDGDGKQVEWSVNSNYVLYENLNINSSIMRGVELTASWRALETLTIRANYTYTDSRQQTGEYEGLPLARTPRHMGNLRADWITPVENLQAWTSANYHGKEINASFRAGRAGRPVYRNGKIIAREYNDYFTLDMGASYAVNDNVKLNAAIYNLLDKRISVDQFNDVVEGRRLWVSMTSTF